MNCLTKKDFSEKNLGDIFAAVIKTKAGGQYCKFYKITEKTARTIYVSTLNHEIIQWTDEGSYVICDRNRTWPDKLKVQFDSNNRAFVGGDKKLAKTFLNEDYNFANFYENIFKFEK